MDPDLVFSVKDVSLAASVFDGAAGSVRLPDKSTVYWRPPPAYLEHPTLLMVLPKHLKTAVGAI